MTTVPPSPDAIGLLAAQQAIIPELGELRWTLRPGIAIANLNELGSTRVVPGTSPGTQTLLVVPPPATLPWIERLHSAGWRRTSRIGSGPWWQLSAYLRSGGATLQVTGAVYETPDGTRFTDANASIPYFAPPPPHGRGAAALRAYEQWLHACATDAW
ncbi:hypothetical protein [Actinomadura violacea]|uniref:Uncharacterized protein n=1 Tax=Actinomadura violacea TaxID=2819934 RepID=A0ABS3S7U9_9ACTN|nr:hypothetical protein [Actinomadura violacea]MBO2464961.1 hypothetical protein [Actinomadura violacea]